MRNWDQGHQITGRVYTVAFDIWARATAKWRGLLVYTALSMAMRIVTALIFAGDPTLGIRLFAAAASVATTVFCLTQTWRLLMSDSDGDEEWPPLWS